MSSTYGQWCCCGCCCYDDLYFYASGDAVVIVVADNIDVVVVPVIVICPSNCFHHNTCTFPICLYKQNTSYLQKLSKMSLKGSYQESNGQTRPDHCPLVSF